MVRKRKSEGDATDKITSKPTKKKLKKGEKIAHERELRRYAKRSGGFRKGITADQKETAQNLMKILGRKHPEWDKYIVVPGYDNPTVKGMVLQD